LSTFSQYVPAAPDRQAQVENAAAAIKSAMMEMERKRVEAVKRRQERELERLVDAERRLTDLQVKIMKQEEEEVRKRKAHEKQVEEQRAADRERKKQR